MARSPVNITIAGSGRYRQVLTTPGWESVIQDNTYASTALQFSEVCTGVSRPKPQGWMDPTGYSLVSRRVSHIRGSLRYLVWTDPNFKYTTTHSGVLGGSFNIENYFGDDASEAKLVDSYGLANRALIGARNALKGERVNLGVAWGERKRTAQLLGDTAIRLAQSILALKKGQFKTAARHLGLATPPRRPRGANFPQEWLALQYGWKPFLSDVYGSVEALKKRQPSDWRITGEGRAKIRLTPSSITDGGVTKTIASANLSVSARCRIDAVPQNDVLVSFNQVGVLNPLLVAWELAPVSFVVDWALPIGDYLNSLDAMVGMSQTDSYTCTSVLGRGSWDVTISRGDSPPESYKEIEASASGSKRMVVLNRSVSQGAGMPHPPGLKNPASLGHMANGLALLSQVLSKGRSYHYR